MCVYSHNSDEETCVVPDVNFHDEWTYSEAESDYHRGIKYLYGDYTTYFLKQPGVSNECD